MHGIKGLGVLQGAYVRDSGIRVQSEWFSGSYSHSPSFEKDNDLCRAPTRIKSSSSTEDQNMLRSSSYLLCILDMLSLHE